MTTRTRDAGLTGWLHDGRAVDRERIGGLAARFLGAATATYAAVTLVRPRVLAGPTGLGRSSRVDVLVRAVGVRDLASGLALALATGREAAVAAGIVRIASDLGDAVAFGRSPLPRAGRRKAVAVAVGWAMLNASALAVRLSGRRAA